MSVRPLRETGRTYRHPVRPYSVVPSMRVHVSSNLSSSYTKVVMTGPKISDTIVSLLGSLVTITVGWT